MSVIDLRGYMRLRELKVQNRMRIESCVLINEQCIGNFSDETR